MGGISFVPLTAAYPQTSENRIVSDILDDLADYVGGGDRPAANARARRALQAAVRWYNTVAWRFQRFRQDITLVNNTTDYPLAAAFRTPRAASLLDTSTRMSGTLIWVPYEDWVRYDGDEVSPATSPETYTCRNVFQTGLVTFLPRLGTINTQYPKVRIDYHARITVPASDSSILSVPSEVEEAIVQEAVAIIVAKSRTFAESREARVISRDMRATVEREWRDFPDSGQHNEA